MSLFSEPQTIAVIVLNFVALVIIHQWRRSSILPLPPGPRPGFLSSSFSIFPKTWSFTQAEELTRQYGPVFSLKQGLKTIIVVGRVRAVIDIMEKQGAATVDRPKNTPGKVLSGGMRVTLLSSGERLRTMRRLLYLHLQPKMVAAYSPILMERTKQHILGILDTPSDHQLHAKYFAASVAMRLTYGITPERYDDPDITTLKKCIRRIGETPGKFKVQETFPFIRHIPGYFDELEQGHAEELALFGGKLHQVKERLAHGEEISPCFARYLVERQKDLGISDGEAAYVSGSSMFGACTEMLHGVISIAVMAAACHPDAQCRVQEELCRVIGERAPTLADLDTLIELQAFAMETLRWRPVGSGAFGFAHKTSKEIFWQNYRIPKDTTIVGNIWSIARDPEFFPDPEMFDPQRWINKDGKIKEDLRHFTYGFGRRVCPASHLANVSILLNTALLLWAFNIKENPSSPIDTMAFEACLAISPRPFNVIFEPRAANAPDGIRDILNGY